MSLQTLPIQITELDPALDPVKRERPCQVIKLSFDRLDFRPA